MKFSEYVEMINTTEVNEDDNPQQLAQIKTIDSQIDAKKKQIESLNKQLAQLVQKKASLGGMVDKEQLSVFIRSYSIKK